MTIDFTKPVQTRDGALALIEAAVGLRDDLLSRAEWDGDARIVCAGAGAWVRFNDALEAELTRWQEGKCTTPRKPAEPAIDDMIHRSMSKDFERVGALEPADPVGETSALAEELERLDRAAYPAPWCWEQCGDKSSDPVIGAAWWDDDESCTPLAGEILDTPDNLHRTLYRECIAYEMPSHADGNASANASLIVALRNNLPTILAALSSTPERGWRPIETFNEPTAPGPSAGVLIACADGAVGEAYFRNFGTADDGGWWWVNTTWGDYPEPERPVLPLYWQPLPEPPTKGSTDE